jgi:hypothetical protein
MRSIPVAFPKIVGAVRHPLFVLLFYTLLFVLFFSHALFSGQIIGLVDAVSYHLPYFYARKVLWDTLLLGGFPMMADPQVMTWYPPAALFSLLPGGWNLFIISAYVLASSFTYGYVYTLTESRLAGAVGGIVYGMSGFMVAQLDHATIIHCAAWLPLIIWSLEMLRRKSTGFWFVAGCIGVACNNLAGHSQIFVYSMMTGAAYAIITGWPLRVARKRYYALTALMLALGVGLAAVQIIPTLELASLSVRAKISYELFVSYSLPPGQVLMMFFPALFGGLKAYGGAPYFGEWNLIELTGYVGLLPLMLAAVGLVAHRQRAVSVFWLCAGALAFLLAMGSATPLARIAYQLPVLGLFRVQARHLFLVAFAVSTLAGAGVSGILRVKVSRALVLKTVVACAALLLLCVAGIYFAPVHEYAARKGVALVSLLPWRNRAVGVPLVIFLVSAASLLYWQARPASKPRGVLVVAALLLDMGSFGWFYARENVVPKETLQPPATVARYADKLRAENQRMIPAEGVTAQKAAMPPNQSRLWDVPSASIYGPLVLSRTQQFLPMHPLGDLDPAWQKGGDESLNLMAVRYVFTPRIELTEDVQGINWFKEETGINLGSGCNIQNPTTARIELPSPYDATEIGIASLLGCSTLIADGEEVMRILVTDANGASQTLSLRAGSDTSEWAHDCGDVLPQIKHGRAALFRSFTVDRGGSPCEGHEYLSRLQLKTAPIKSLEFQWTGSSGTISIKRISLINGPAGTSLPLGAQPGSIGDAARWRHLEDISGTSVYENLRAMPRAWLASEALSVKPDEALRIIKSGRLPDGRIFDPSRTALVQEDAGFKQSETGASGEVRVLVLLNGYVELKTEARSPTFLVLSDVYYPGWKVTVDGAEATLYNADSALRGVALPAGSHTVRMVFRPASFYYGLVVSLLSLVCISVLLLLLKRVRSKRLVC